MQHPSPPLCIKSIRHLHFESCKCLIDFNSHRLSDWQNKGYIQKVINRFYTWPNKPLDESQIAFIANRIDTPSYISLKSALRWYNFIPEGVFQQFSVTTRKTKDFETPIGDFRSCAAMRLR